ncbi:hypothetical protein MCEBALA9_00030 [Candidatus Nanopelagicaceae bacterium]
MKRFVCLIVGCIFALSNPTFLYAHTEGATSVHELTKQDSPTALLDIQKDPTGGFNVRVKSTNFVWRPEMASMQHVPGEGHAHVYLDGRKIMRIYNEWFHLNTYQFATRSGEQLLSIEFVGNDHAPYTLRGLPIGAEQIVDVPADEIQPTKSRSNLPLYGLIFLALIALGALIFRGKSAK